MNEHIERKLELILKVLTRVLENMETMMATEADLTNIANTLTASSTALVTAANAAVAAIQAGTVIPDQVITDLTTANANIQSASAALAAVTPSAA
jgi:uncharacterized Rossmann fold enzyme